MTFVEKLARLDKTVRPVLLKTLSSWLSIKIYSHGRNIFLNLLDRERPPAVQVPAELSQTIWGIEFRSPIFNAAGIFKNGKGYQCAYLQGAGAFLGGTGTLKPRTGNLKKMIRWPFVPLASSRAALNWMGLPNEGATQNANTIKKLPRYRGFPLGWSVSAPPDLQGCEKLDALLESLNIYAEAGVDFLEINESCPNTEADKSEFEELKDRLEFISKNFLKPRSRPLPVIVKFSTDTEITQISQLLKILIELEFDGVNFGNTSTSYESRREFISTGEAKLYHYFTGLFGGGISGHPLKPGSLALIEATNSYLKSDPPAHEFHLIRTGGIENASDLKASKKAGATLNQWYTGYFEAFSESGHKVYSEIYKGL